MDWVAMLWIKLASVTLLRENLSTSSTEMPMSKSCSLVIGLVRRLSNAVSEGAGLVTL